MQYRALYAAVVVVLCTVISAHTSTSSSSSSSSTSSSISSSGSCSGSSGSGSSSDISLYDSSDVYDDSLYDFYDQQLREVDYSDDSSSTHRYRQTNKSVKGLLASSTAVSSLPISFNDINDDIDLYPLQRSRQRHKPRNDNDRVRVRVETKNVNNSTSNSYRKKSRYFNWIDKQIKETKVNDKMISLPKVDMIQLVNMYKNVSHQVGTKAVLASKISLKVALLYASIITVRWLLIKTISFIKENQYSVKGLKILKMTRRAAWKTRYWFSNQANNFKKAFIYKKNNDNNNKDDTHDKYNNDDNHINITPEEIKLPNNNSIIDYEKIEKEQEEIWQSLGYLLNTTKSQHDDIRKSINELADKQHLGQQHLIETIELIEKKNKVSQNSMIEATFDEMQFIRTDFANKISDLREQISKDIEKIVEQQTKNEEMMLKKLKEFVDTVKRIDITRK